MQIFYGDEPMRQRILQDLRDEYQGMSHDGTGRERFMMYCSLVKVILNSYYHIPQREPL